MIHGLWIDQIVDQESQGAHSCTNTPEKGINLPLRPFRSISRQTTQFQMVMERRHAEDPASFPCPFFRPFEIGHLEHDRASLKDVDNPNQEQGPLYVESHG